MVSIRQLRQWRGLRLVSYFALGWLTLAVLLTTAQPALAADGDADKPNFFLQVLTNLFNSHALMEVLRQNELYAFIAVNLIVFVETGLMVGFCLPGDSLLVTAGLAAALGDWNLPLLLATVSLSAIVGDSVGYSIGFKTGPKIFCRERSWFFNKDHLLKAQVFYEKHGGKTIVLARFMPIIRTFAPVVAGVGQMRYRHFLAYNVLGGIGWVCSMVLCGYYLPALLNPVLRPIFGDAFAIQDHVEKVVIVVVLVSIAPGIYVWLRHKLAGKKEVLEEQKQLAA
jgi:membrane-associated protein